MLFHSSGARRRAIRGYGERDHDDSIRHAPSLTSSAPRSAIMIVVALVFTQTIRGMTDASITLRFSTPRTRRSESTTASSPVPIAHVPTGWK
jgi:hypothetical protein